MKVGRNIIALIWAAAATSFLIGADHTFVFAGLSITPEPWDKVGNLDKLERFAREAAARGASVIATPEGYLEGYIVTPNRSPNLTREKYATACELIDGPLLTRISRLASELKVYLLIGFAERRDEKFYNSAVIFSPDGSVASRYAKTHNVAGVEPFNTLGTEFVVVDTSYGRWGTLVCYDRQFPETMRILALKGAQLILVPAWGGYGEMNDIRMRARADENGIWIAFVHPKRCLIIDSKGNLVAENDGEEDQIVMGTITLRPEFDRDDKLENRRPEIYGELVKSPNSG